MNNGEEETHVVELVSSSTDTDSSSLTEEITPLLTEDDKPKINIFTIPYVGEKPKEQVTKVVETDVSPFSRFITWTWSGSKYSGLLCMAISSTIYSIMEILSYIFSVRPIPLFESIFARCVVIMFSSFVWLRRTGQPIFGPPNVRSLLVSRALVGYLSLFSFVYSIQSLLLPQAIILNFLTPVLASLAARIILQEKLRLAHVGALVACCSLFYHNFLLEDFVLPDISSFVLMIILGGLAFVAEVLLARGLQLERTIRVTNMHYIEDFVLPDISSFVLMIILGGLAFVAEVLLARGLQLERTIRVTNMHYIEDFVLPDISSFVLMIILGGLAFVAEVLLARGLQLERTIRVTNMHYIEPFLLEIWSIAFSRVKPSIGGFIGCLLILLSLCSTIYYGPEKEIES